MLDSSANDRNPVLPIIPVIDEALGRLRYFPIGPQRGLPHSSEIGFGESALGPVGAHPVKLGLVASFNLPGGNATGINILTASLGAKRLGLLHEVAPHAETIGVLFDPNFPGSESQLADLRAAANTIGLHIQVMGASTVSEIDAAFEMIANAHIAALVVAATPFFDSNRDQLMALAASHAVPVISQFREYAAAGGLMSYGIDLPDVYRQVGDYAGRILKGEKPADIPVLQPTKFEFVINLKAAKVLGVTIPAGVLAIAYEVIE
jgi:putative tryptophan/tyrosine transport system substrate-binding protein